MNSTLQNLDRYLALDTAGNTIAAAVCVSGDIQLISAERLEARDRNIAVLTEELLQQVELSFPNIQGVIVALGPGSFTGLRVGLSFAKGIVAARGIPLVGVTRFEQIAFQQQISGATTSESMLVMMKPDSYYRFSASDSQSPQFDVVTTAELDDSRKLCFIDCDIPTIFNHSNQDSVTNRVTKISSTIEGLYGAAEEKYEYGNLPSWTDIEPLYIQRSRAEIMAEEALKTKANSPTKDASSKNV